MKIGELAKIAGCKTVTIRFYERKGLLRQGSRSDANYRLYGELDVQRLAFIKNCRALGLGLREIARLIEIQSDPAVDCSDVNTCLDKHLQEVDDQMQALKQLRSDLARLRRRCMTPGASSGCGVLTALVAEELKH